MTQYYGNGAIRWKGWETDLVFRGTALKAFGFDRFQTCLAAARQDDASPKRGHHSGCGRPNATTRTWKVEGYDQRRMKQGWDRWEPVSFPCSNETSHAGIAPEEKIYNDKDKKLKKKKL